MLAWCVSGESKVAELVRAGLLRSGRLAEAMRTVRREDFVPPAWRGYACAEVPLPLPGRLASVSCPHSYPPYERRSWKRCSRRGPHPGAGTVAES
jgi:protein-L-isoaspartate(D-aspartate) O-methyltransferase (PCMT)